MWHTVVRCVVPADVFPLLGSVGIGHAMRSCACRCADRGVLKWQTDVRFSSRAFLTRVKLVNYCHVPTYCVQINGSMAPPLPINIDVSSLQPSVRTCEYIHIHVSTCPALMQTCRCETVYTTCRSFEGKDLTEQAIVAHKFKLERRKSQCKTGTRDRNRLTSTVVL